LPISGLADTAAQHQQIDDAAVVHVHVVPVVHRRAVDDHRGAVGLGGVVGKFPGDADDLGAGHPGDLFLPGRGVGQVVVEGGGAVAAAQALVDAVVGQGEVVDGGHQGGTAVRQQYFLHRHLAQLYLGVVGVVEVAVFVGLTAEIGEGHLGDVVGAILEGQGQAEVGAGVAVPLLDIPLAAPGGGFSPAVADGAVGGHQVAADLVQGDGFPVRVVVLAQVAGEVAGPQKAALDQA